MSELIDRQALLNAIEKDVYASDSIKSFMRCVAKRFPTIDAVPVVHGEWIPVQIGKWKGHKCSNCGISFEVPCSNDGIPQWKYCHECGARMGERREG